MVEISVGLLKELLFALGQVWGSHGSGVVTLTAAIRLAFLPLGVRVARSARRRQRVMKRLEPELTALRRRHRKDPRRLAEALTDRLAEEGLSTLPGLSLLLLAVQLPTQLALFAAVRQVSALGGRFLWLRDLSRPDLLLTILVTLVTALSVRAGLDPEALKPAQRTVLLVASSLMTMVALSQLASGVGLSWGTSALVAWLQARIARRPGRSPA